MIKRAFDLTVSILLLSLLWPLLIIIAVVARINLGSPILFKQKRPGLHGKTFEIIKFRSMNNARGANGELLPDEQRLTKFGQFLRRTSLDELPELWNVLRGEMSLVGPRPLLEEYLTLYSKEQMKRHNVRPGITGLAQINGRNSLSWDDKFKLDSEYVSNNSITGDIEILVKTVAKVLKRDGISEKGEATASKFKGNSC